MMHKDAEILCVFQVVSIFICIVCVNIEFMKKKTLFYIILTFCIFAFFSGGCSKSGGKSEKQQVVYNHDNDVYIEAISPFSIGRMEPISVSFTETPSGKMDSAVSISPSPKGEWTFLERQAVFTPSEPFKGESQIILSVDCKKLFGVNYDDCMYRHEFVVKSPEYKITFDDIKLNPKTGEFTVSGAITTDIEEQLENISSVVAVKENGAKKNVEWNRTQVAESWKFSFPVLQDEKKKSVEISWNGKKLGVSSELDKLISGTKKIEFPEKGELAVLDINKADKNMISVSFSKELDESQDVSSFISFTTGEDKTPVDYSKYNSVISGNVLTVFADSSFPSSVDVSFNKGIKSVDGTLLERSASAPVSGSWDKPEIRFANDGIILPSSKGAVLPVETKNLQGLLIQAYAIESRNMNQFLQVNELDGTNELYRVGEPVWEKKVFFKWEDSHKDQFVVRGLDLSELVKKYPDGMFQIKVAFRHDQIMYNCTRGHRDFSSIPMPADTIEDTDAPRENSWWDYYDNLDYETRSSFWYYDDDPCHPAYYMPRYNSRCIIKRNVLITDLALIAKRSSSGKYYVTVTDLRTAAPVKNAEVSLYSFVGKKLATGKTDENGNIAFGEAASLKTCVITASNGNCSSFLKISGGTSLSTSHFEIGGEKAVNGVKGAIYGERGVWRPGDDIHLTFVLQDLNKSLPADIPVNFTLTDPLGRTSDTQVLTNSVNGFYAISTKTFSDSSTGNWVAKVKIGGREWSKSLKVEAVVPNKLAVELEFLGDYLTPDSNKFKLSGSWLHGAPVPNYSADVSVMFTQAATTFNKFNDYTFTNSSRSFSSDREIVWSGSLDAYSVANFSSDLYVGRNLPGKLRANFISRIFEPSGAYSTQSKSIEYSPYKNYVGIKLPKGDAARNMLLTDTEHTADLVLLDAKGNLVDSGEVSWKIYKLDWKWWWEKDAYSNATYVSSGYARTIDSGEATIKNGRGSFKFQVKYPEWGRYFVVANDSEGHSAGKIVYIDWPGWAGRAQEDGSGSASMVTMVTDKRKYTVGETAQITFTANKSSKALVTIEKAGEVYKQEWIDTKDGTTLYKLPVTEDMSPNVYVHLTLLQPHGQSENSLPVRLYGIVPVNVDNPRTILTPVITSSSSFQPNSQSTISVSEKNGKPMTYTLAVVDEGLLGLTNFHSIDLRSEFYKKEASLLQTWDLYKYVMSAYSGKLETLLAIGGSEDIKANEGGDENRFKPVVKFFGPYTIQPGEKKATTFQMPEYIGAVRAMVIAGYDGAYGTTEKTIPVKSELMVQSTLPRTLGTNEDVMVPVTVFNNTDKQQSASVQLEVSGAMKFSSSQNVALAPDENKTVFFKVSTKDEGSATFKSTISNGASSAKAETRVDVKSRGFPVTYKKLFTVQPGKSEKVSVASPTENSTTELFAEISSFPQISLESRLAYLTEYPHGCIEQITSGGFPQLFIPDFVKLSKEQVENVKRNVNSVIDRYPTYQTSEKTFGYWPGNQTTHDWGTCYASHFLVEAKNHGYSVPDEMINKALAYLNKSASDWTGSSSGVSESTQAYRLFVLALAGKANIGAMNRLMLSDSLSGESSLLLAASYAKSGRQSTATEILDKFKSSGEGRRSTGDDFSSSLRERALLLFTYNLAGETESASRVAKKIAETLSSDAWLSTQETAWSLFSLIPFYTSQSKIAASYEIAAAGKSIKNEISGGTIVEALPATQSANQEVTVANKGDKVIFGTLISKGMSKAGTEVAENSGISLSVAGLSGISQKKLGDSVSIGVKVTNTSGKEIKNIALTIPVPTGFEFTNERLSSDYEGSNYTYQDIRDDAIYTYFDLKSGESLSFTFDATLAYSGNYVIPAIHAEAMYDNDICAIYPGQSIQMIK